MRNTDPEPTAGKPILGERVTKAPAAPSELLKQGWRPKPGSPGIEVNERGELRTNIPGAWK